MLAISLLGCESKDAAFEKAIAKVRGTGVDSVAKAGEELPFYAKGSLNPIWSEAPEAERIVIPEFSLMDQDGKVRDAMLFEGKTTVVGFFFASCSGFCPFLVESMKKVEKENPNIHFVAITVNPEEDTPSVLKSYAEHKKIPTDKNWTLLTGDKEVIETWAKQTFKSQLFKRKGENAGFVHSEHLYVIDSQKQLRAVLNGTRVDIAKQVSEALNKPM